VREVLGLRSSALRPPAEVTQRHPPRLAVVELATSREREHVAAATAANPGRRPAPLGDALRLRPVG
ncbi:MAG: hypothetical protein OEV29_11505, partial [Thermoleophilia bacterium]|nr:hypothetical protein [Thermoleophilia bacterium]